MWIDERGRLFGVNVIDGFVAVAIAVCLPLAYGAYRLFRQPPIVITAAEPQVWDGWSGQDIRVILTGSDIPPYLKARVGTTPVVFRLQDPEHAELQVPRTLVPGLYTITLLDEANVRLVLPWQFQMEIPELPLEPLWTPTLPPSPEVQVWATVSFIVRLDVAQGVVAGDWDGPEVDGQSRAQLVACGPSSQQLTAQMGLGGGNMLSVPQAVVGVTCRVRVPLRSVADIGWVYRGRVVLPGVAFDFVGQQSGVMQGWVTTVRH